MVKQTLNSTKVSGFLPLAEEKVVFNHVASICWRKLFKSSKHVRYLSKMSSRTVNTCNFPKFNTRLTRTQQDPFPFSLPHFPFLFYFPLFSHGCHIQSCTSLRAYSAQYKSSRPVLCGPEESMPLKKQKKELSRSLSMVIEFLNIFSKSA